MALLNVPVAKKVSEVAKDGEDAIPHVGQHGHQEWSLLIVLQKGLLVQATVAWRNILVLEGSKIQSICHVTNGSLRMWQDSVQASTCQTTYAFILFIKTVMFLISNSEARKMQLWAFTCCWSVHHEFCRPQKKNKKTIPVLEL